MGDVFGSVGSGVVVSVWLLFVRDEVCVEGGVSGYVANG